jgi:hypothetical protein
LPCPLLSLSFHGPHQVLAVSWVSHFLPSWCRAGQLFPSLVNPLHKCYHKLHFLLASPFCSSNRIAFSIAMSTAFSLISWSASSSHCVMGIAFSPVVRPCRTTSPSLVHPLRQTLSQTAFPLGFSLFFKSNRLLHRHVHRFFSIFMLRIKFLLCNGSHVFSRREAVPDHFFRL